MVAWERVFMPYRGTPIHYQRAYNSSMCPGHSGVPCGRVIGTRGRMAERCFDCAEYRDQLQNIEKHKREAAKRKERIAKGLPVPSKTKPKNITRPSELRDRIFAEPGRKAAKMCPVCCNMPWARIGICSGCFLPYQPEQEVAPRSLITSSAALALLP